MSTVPMFSPDGQLGDIPYERMMDALKAGAKPGVTVKSPDGKLGVVPANRAGDAVKAGGTIVPIQDQETQHPGFWANAAEDIKGLGKYLMNAGPTSSDGSEIQRDADYQKKLISEGRSLPYRALMSLTPEGMRQSAESGDVGGVVGHTVVPLATAGAQLVPGEAIPNAAGAAASKAAPIVRATARGVNKVLEKAPGSVGGAAGAAIGHATGIPGAAEIGGAAGYAIGREVLPKVRIPGEGAGFPGRVEGGPAVAPKFEMKAFQQAAKELGPQATVPEVLTRAQQIAKLSDLLNDSMGGKGLEPNVPLKNQSTASAPKTSLPEGHTAVDSSALKSYSYNPKTQEFESVTQNGQHYIHADVSPEQAAAFEASDSKGKAWNALRQNSTLVAKVIKGKRVPVMKAVSDADQISAEEWAAGHELESAVEGSRR